MPDGPNGRTAQVSMGERKRSDLELGHLLGHLLLDAQRKGSLPDLLKPEAPQLSGPYERWLSDIGNGDVQVTVSLLYACYILLLYYYT